MFTGDEERQTACAAARVRRRRRGGHAGNYGWRLKQRTFFFDFNGAVTGMDLGVRPAPSIHQDLDSHLRLVAAAARRRDGESPVAIAIRSRGRTESAHEEGV